MNQMSEATAVIDRRAEGSAVFAVVIGASAGGVPALLELASHMPAPFPAIVLVVQHIGAHQSLLPELMRARGPNHAVHAQDGEEPAYGTLYVAPPDHHMLLEDGRLRLLRGPKENHCRPAIDPLFRSAALAYRERAIGVVLTGQLDDGSAGLRAIKECGGTAIVQDPSTAVEPGMPQSALDNVEVDHCLKIEDMVPAVLRLVRGSAVRASHPDLELVDALRREQDMLQGGAMENLPAIAKPSSLTCPDCGGGLWELNDAKPLRYRCHTGHAFSALSLEHSQSVATEHALWSSVRALHEKEILLRRVASVSRAQGAHAQAEAGEAQAQRVREQAELLTRMLDGRDSA